MAVRIQAKTVEEAIKLGLEKTGWAREDVVVTVVKEKRGWFGPKWVEVEIRLRKPPTASANADDGADGAKEDVPQKDRDGRLWFVDGLIHYDPPVGRGRFPTIRVTKGVRLKAGDKVVDVFPFVFDGQQDVIVEAVDQPPERRVDVQVSDNGLQAKMRVEYINGYTAELRSQPEPQVALTLRATLQDVEAPRFSVDELKAALAEKGVVFGIQEDRLEQLAREGSQDWVVVAEGIPPQDGIDGRIELIVHDDNWQMLNRAESRIGQLLLRDIESVEQGQLVARLYPALPGRDGTSVTGQPIPHKPGKEVQMKAGKGVRLNETGTEAIAEISGRPVINKNVVTILPIHVVRGDLTFKEGGIRFKGDVAVHGNVLDGVELEAVGNVYLYGNVNNARVAAQGNIMAEKTVFGGRLIAGVASEDVLHAEQLLKQIQEHVNKMREGIQLLRRHRPELSRQSDQKLALLLLDNKFQNLPNLVEQFYQMIRNNPLLQEWSAGLEKELRHHFQRSVLMGTEEVDFEKLAEDIEERLALLDENEEGNRGNIVARSLNNTTVEASGDVRIKESVYYSRIYARGSVVCLGYVRASEIYADGDVQCEEAGTRSGTKAVIALKGVFRARKVYPNVEVTVNGEKELFDREAYDVVLPRSAKEMG